MVRKFYIAKRVRTLSKVFVKNKYDYYFFYLSVDVRILMKGALYNMFECMSVFDPGHNIARTSLPIILNVL